MRIGISRKDKLELYKIAAEGAKLRNTLMVASTPLTPLNFSDEIEKFLKSTTYNPQFKYDIPALKRYDLIIDNLERRVELLDLPSDFFSHLIDYLNHLRLLYHTRRSIGKPTFPIYAGLVFNWEMIKPEAILKAVPKTKFQNEEKGELLNAKQIRDRLQEAIDKDYKSSRFRVHINNFSTNLIFVDFDTLYIGKNIKRFQNNVDRLIAHEIESHLIQNLNIRDAKNPLLVLSKYSQSELYSEGLAVYNEINTKTITKKSFDNYYYRLKAINNLHLSFRDIFEMLHADGLSIKHSLNIAYRVKRGLSDTSRPGGFPKDSAYLLGYKAVLDFLKSNPKKTMYFAKNPNLTTLLMKHNLLGKKKIVLPKFYNSK